MLFKIKKESGIPLLGTIYFGVIDRGTNLLQIRAYCGCNLNCPFCSVDAGPFSKTRVTEYVVELEYLISYIKEIIKFKDSNNIECHIDSTGEPMLYPSIIELVQELRKLPEVKTISIQTNGTLLTEEKIKQLETAGLSRINLSILSMEPELAKKLSGVPWYDVENIKETAKLIAKSKIDLLIAPVYLPKLNDEEIPKIIKFALEIGAGKNCPPLGIQKFEKHKLGRKPKGIGFQSWWRFYNKYLKSLEKEFNTKLILHPRDFGIYRTKSLPVVMEKNEKLSAKIVAQGWLKKEMIGIARDRCISIMDCQRKEGNIRVKIVSNKHNIYVAVPA